MRQPYKLAVLASLALIVGVPAIATAKNAYLPIRSSVAHGTYHSPNYLSVVNSALGREGSYSMFSNVVEAKYPHTVGRFGKDEILVHALQKQRTQRRMLLGMYAEERFVELNREAGWQKVGDQFAPQRDVWRRIDGKVQYGQIKVHGVGRAAPTMRDLAGVYLESMRKDSGRGQASLFLVPDDHVDAIRQLINERHGAALRRGNSADATWLLKQEARLSPLGVTYEVLSHEAELAQQAGRARIVARYAGPVITVVYLGGSAAYETYRWSSGTISGSDLGVQLGKTGSIVTVSLSTSFLVSKSEFFMASPYRAGGVVTAVIFIAEEGWLIYQYGGFSSAFSSPEFVVKTGGNFGAATLGFIGFVEGGKLGAALGTPLGPWGTAVGGAIGGIGGGAIGGTVGYLGGATLTDRMLETFSPEFYYGMKLQEIDKAEAQLKQEIDRVTNLARPLSVINSAR